MDNEVPSLHSLGRTLEDKVYRGTDRQRMTDVRTVCERGPTRKPVVYRLEKRRTTKERFEIFINKGKTKTHHIFIWIFI